MKPVKFSRGSGCLVRDEFLVIFKGDHVLIYVYIFEICRCWALYCTALRSFNLIYLGSIFSVAFLESCDNFPESYHMCCRMIILANLCSPMDPLIAENPTKTQAVHSKMSMEKHRNAYLPYHVQNLQLLRHENILVVWMTVNDSFWRARRCPSVESANVPLHPQ